jgi:putative endonuclease
MGAGPSIRSVSHSRSSSPTRARTVLSSLPMPDARQVLGAEGERAAEQFLRRQRYTIVQRNYRCPVGELDLVALDRGAVVFIEVKTRTQPGCGSPLEAVDQRKQRQIQRAAQYYLSAHRLRDRDARFDVVGVWYEGGRLQCELVRNAFEVR